MTDAWAYRARQRAEQAGALAENVSRADVWAKTRGHCAYCGRRLDPADWQADHFVPLNPDDGGHGTHTLANLWPSCDPCNRRKSNARPVDLPPPGATRNAMTVLWRLGVRTSYARTVPGPATWTVMLALDPADMPTASRADEQVTAAIGSALPVRLTQAGRYLAVQIPRPRPRVVPLALMPHSGLEFGVGVTAAGVPLKLHLGSPPKHVFVAGASQSGKSQVLRAIAAGLALGCKPEALRIELVDFKRQTWTGPLARLAHSKRRVAYDVPAARSLVAEFNAELDRRIGSTPDGDPWTPDAPPWVLAIDELHNLGDAGALMRLAREGLAFGLHIVAATQVQRAKELDPRIVSQFGARFCSRVAPSDVHTSSAVVGSPDATQLAYPGDVLALVAPAVRPVRLAVAYAAPSDPWWTSAIWAGRTRTLDAAAPVVDRRRRHSLTPEVRAKIMALPPKRGGTLPAINRVARALGISNDAAGSLLQELAA